MTRPVTDRMAAALADLSERTKGRRQPKAFYLGPDDWNDFLATDPPVMPTVWNGEHLHEETFSDVPVRPSKNVPGRSSRLYDHTGTGRGLPS